MIKLTFNIEGYSYPIVFTSCEGLNISDDLYFKKIEAFYRKSILPLARTFGESVIKDLNSSKIQSATVKIISYKNPQNESSYSPPKDNTVEAQYDVRFGYIEFNTKHLREGLELDNDDKDWNEYDNRNDKYNETVIRPISKKLSSIQKKHENIFKNITKEIYHDSSIVGRIGDYILKSYIRTTIRVLINL